MTGISIFGRGLRVKPVKGDCSLFWDHVKVIVCCGKEAHYIYVRKWLAHLIQKPWIIATALVFEESRELARARSSKRSANYLALITPHCQTWIKSSGDSIRI